MKQPSDVHHPRQATLADGPEIVRVTNQAYHVESTFLKGERTHGEDVAELMATGDFIVLDEPGEGNRLRASVYLQYLGERGYLGLLAVNPAFQGQGLSRLLMAEGEARCRAAGCKFLDLTVVNLRLDLFPFYAKMGYAPCGT